MESIMVKAPTYSLTAAPTQDNGKMASNAAEDKKKKSTAIHTEVIGKTVR